MSQTFEPPTELKSGRPTTDAGASVDKIFSISDHCRFSLDNPSGRVRVVGSDRSQIELHATRRGNPTSARYQATRVEFSQEGDTVSVRTILDPSAAFADLGTLGGIAAEMLNVFGELIRPNNFPCEVEYEVRVPRCADLDLKGVSSSIALHGVQGALRARSVSGNVTADDLTGDLDLASVSGQIRAHAVAGRLAIESVSGDVETAGTLSAVRAKTVSGAIEIAGPLDVNGTYDLHSVSGNATLRVPGSTGATVTVRGMSSAVSCDLPCQITRNRTGPGKHQWQGVVSGGGATVRFQSVSGNLRLSELRLAPTAPLPAAPTETTSPEESVALPVETAAIPDAPTVTPTETTDDDTMTMQVLKGLERGDLSVDEALRRLESLRVRGGQE